MTNGVIPEENGFYEYPDCYALIDDEYHETLLLEDLKKENFEMIDHRKDTVTFDHARLVFHTLGKYHALSFALRDQQPEKFQEYASSVPELLFVDKQNGLREYFDTIKPLMYATFKDDEREALERLERVYDKSCLDVMSSLVDGKSAEPYSVLCHGDFWINNILFKFDEVRFPIQVI